MSNDYRERVKLESEELQGNIDKLSAFLFKANSIDPNERALMHDQLAAMELYLTALKDRIAIHEGTYQ